MKRLAAFAGNNGFNALPVAAQHSDKKTFLALKSNTFKTSKSSTGVVSTVKNSRTLLVDYCRLSGKLRTVSSVTEKVHLPSVR